MTTNPKRTLAADLEKEVRKILAEPDVSIEHRLKAMEIGAKILLARHKTEGGSKDDDFFGR